MDSSSSSRPVASFPVPSLPASDARPVASRAVGKRRAALEEVAGLREAAAAYVADPESKRASEAWVRSAYPACVAVIESQAPRVGLDVDHVLSAFVEQRFHAVRLAAGVAVADSATGYLKFSAGAFVIDEARKTRDERVTHDGDIERARATGEDRAPKGAGELHRTGDHDDAGDPYSVGEIAAATDWIEAASRGDDRLPLLVQALEALSMRDRVLMTAQYIGVWALGPAERAWIAERRGVAIEVVDREIAAELQIVEARIDAMERRLERGVSDAARAIDRVRHAHAALRAAHLKPMARRKAKKRISEEELAATLAKRSARLDRLQARVRNLRASLEDPFCGRPDRSRIAEIVGEANGHVALATATNSAWAQARRVAGRVATRIAAAAVTP
jgi:hypothetical protein